jgi:hypothetical protein
MQQPVCANCVRRDEVCQYPASLDDLSLLSEQGSQDAIPYVSASESILQDRNQSLVQYQNQSKFDSASITRYVGYKAMHALTPDPDIEVIVRGHFVDIS